MFEIYHTVLLVLIIICVVGGIVLSEKQSIKIPQDKQLLRLQILNKSI